MKWRALVGLGIWWLVAAGAAVGLTVIALGTQLRVGGYIVAGSLAGAALGRVGLPSPRGGGLEVRRRFVDVTLLLGFAAAVALAVTLVQLTPR